MKKIALATIIASLTFMACKKSKVEEPAPTPTPPIVGLWKGKFSTTQGGALNQDVIYYFKQGGSMSVYNGVDTTNASQKGNGTWTFSGANTNLLKAQYSYAITPNAILILDCPLNQTLTASMPNAGWGAGDNNGGYLRKGDITLTKQ